MTVESLQVFKLSWDETHLPILLGLHKIPLNRLLIRLHPCKLFVPFNDSRDSQFEHYCENQPKKCTLSSESWQHLLKLPSALPLPSICDCDSFLPRNCAGWQGSHLVAWRCQAALSVGPQGLWVRHLNGCPKQYVPWRWGSLSPTQLGDSPQIMAPCDCLVPCHAHDISWTWIVIKSNYSTAVNPHAGREPWQGHVPRKALRILPNLRADRAFNRPDKIVMTLAQTGRGHRMWRSPTWQYHEQHLIQPKLETQNRNYSYSYWF